ncbi:hypothetical protein FOZ60_002899 [Perkinsus olseni]|uniref:Uncharacterized protein n=1 Tax=Perkinsus olseni TaxID=32597 RepID=A0A7J6NWP3_PEROL|nr:hypothetical protein FOZ60_002899 [Perkinsus olseni]
MVGPVPKRGGRGRSVSSEVPATLRRGDRSSRPALLHSLLLLVDAFGSMMGEQSSLSRNRPHKPISEYRLSAFNRPSPPPVELPATSPMTHPLNIEPNDHDWLNHMALPPCVIYWCTKHLRTVQESLNNCNIDIIIKYALQERLC